ncbi:MAG: hypothetical protein J5546_07015 [Lachnospiraceae bacterium]|nr:hypothetical protein [Lachnospiraceae bacterium]
MRKIEKTMENMELALLRLRLYLEDRMEEARERMRRAPQGMLTATDPGIDGILVTVGLCIIALLLCVVMKDSLTSFIQTIVTSMTTKANGILSGTGH